MKDLVCLHVILMALRVCSWDVDLDALGARMKMSVKELTPLAKELGCAVKRMPGKRSEGGWRDSGDAAARRYQDAHGYTPRDQTEDHGGGEEEVGRMTSGESNVESNHHCTFNKIGHFP
jgi:hypothetical protein